jgi:hypothetical protein
VNDDGEKARGNVGLGWDCVGECSFQVWERSYEGLGVYICIGEEIVIIYMNWEYKCFSWVVPKPAETSTSASIRLPKSGGGGPCALGERYPEASI